MLTTCAKRDGQTFTSKVHRLVRFWVDVVMNKSRKNMQGPGIVDVIASSGVTRGVRGIDRQG